MLIALELQLAKEIIEVLRLTEAVTKKLRGEHYVTSSKLILMVNCMRKRVQSLRFKVELIDAKALVEHLLLEITRRF